MCRWWYPSGKVLCARYEWAICVQEGSHQINFSYRFEDSTTLVQPTVSHLLVTILVSYGSYLNINSCFDWNIKTYVSRYFVCIIWLFLNQYDKEMDNKWAVCFIILIKNWLYWYSLSPININLVSIHFFLPAFTRSKILKRFVLVQYDVLLIQQNSRAGNTRLNYLVIVGTVLVNGWNP